MENFRSNAPAAQAPPSAEAAAETSSQGVDESRSWPDVDRRGGARYTVSADALVIDARSRARLRGRASDLSLSGCYLDAITLFPVGTSVQLRLTCKAHSFECEARVTYSLRGMGMGLAFVKISPDQATELRRWIAELSGELAATAPSLVPKLLVKEPAESEKTARWQAVVSELVTVLHRKGLLDESEAASLRSKLSR